MKTKPMVALLLVLALSTFSCTTMKNLTLAKDVSVQELNQDYYECVRGSSYTNTFSLEGNVFSNPAVNINLYYHCMMGKGYIPMSPVDAHVKGYHYITVQYSVFQ